MRCQIVVRAVSGAMQWVASEWLAVQLMACVSAEPKTWQELETALRTYRPQHRLLEHATPLERSDELPVFIELPDEQSWCFIDLVGRTIAVSQDFCDLDGRGGCHEWEPSDEDPSGGWYRVDSSSPRMERLAYIHFPPHWKFFRGRANWQNLVERRYCRALQEPVVDSHRVLWGAPLWEFLARSVRSAPQDGDAESQMREIHIRWMLTPHPLLADCTPQQALMAGCDYVETDMDYRRHYWSDLRRPPEPIPENSYAYCHGPYCEAHHAMHFDYVRTLLEEAWTYREGMATAPVEQWIEALERRAAQWWDSRASLSVSGMTHRQLWSTLRQRIPLLGEAFIDDPECPLCRAVHALDLGPTFEHICWGVTNLKDEAVFAREEVDIPWFPWQMDFQEDDSGRPVPSRSYFIPLLADEFFSATEVDDDEEDLDPVAFQEWRARHATENASRDRDCPAMDSQVAPPARSDSTKEWEFARGCQSLLRIAARTSSDDPAQQCDYPGTRLLIGFPLTEIVQQMESSPENRLVIERVNSLYEQFCAARRIDAIQVAGEQLVTFLEELTQRCPSVSDPSERALAMLRIFLDTIGAEQSGAPKTGLPADTD